MLIVDIAKIYQCIFFPCQERGKKSLPTGIEDRQKI